MLFPRFPKSVNLANPMMGIPGVGASSGQGGFLNRGAGQQPGILPITQTVLMQEAEKRRQSAQKLQEKAMQQMQEAAQLEAPQPRQAISQGEGIGGGILMLLLNALGTDRGEISDFAQNFLAARMQGTNQQNEQDMRRYQMQTNRMGDLANIDMTRAKLDMNEADSIQGRVDAERQRQAREREMLRNREWDVADAETKRKESEITVAQNRYYSANTPAEKQAAAAQLQRLGIPIDPATVEADVTQMRAAKSQSARNAWNTQLNQLRDDYGEIPEWAVPQLEQTKRELAAAYGVPETLFGQIPTGRTLAAQKFDQAKKQFEQTFQLRSEQFKETVAKHQRDYELAKDRIAIMSRNSATSASNLGMRMREFEYRKARDAAEKKFDATAKEITKVEKEIAIQQGVLKKFAPKWAENPALITKEREKLDRLNAELETLKQMRDQSEAEAQEMDSALGDSGAPIPPAVQNTGSGLSATVDPLAANAGRNPNAGPPVQGKGGTKPGAKQSKAAPKTNTGIRVVGIREKKQ